MSDSEDDARCLLDITSQLDSDTTLFKLADGDPAATEQPRCTC